jgi:hypothetical protein
LTPALNALDTFTITVTADDGSTTPTGSVALTFDSETAVTVNLTPGSTAGKATASYQKAFTTSGTHEVVAQFAETATLALSTDTLQVSVPNNGSFTIAASGVTVASGGEGDTTITVTPSGGYTGTVDIKPTSSPISFCYSTTTATVSGTTAVQTSMTIDLKLTDCSSSNTQSGTGMRLFQAGSQKASLGSHASPSIAAAFSFAGLFLAGILGWRRRQLRLLCGLLVLGIAGLALSACGGGGSSSTTTTTTSTNYTITLTGTDSASSAFSATTTFTLTVQ